VVYKDGLPVFAAEEHDLSGFLAAAYQHFELKYPKFYKMDHLSKLGMIAAEVLLKPGFDRHLYNAEDIGVVLSNASASLDTDIKYYETVSEMASPGVFVYTLPNIMIGEICIRNGFKGENAFFVFNSFNPVFIEQYVSYLLNTGILKVCICGWVELIGETYNAVLYLVQKSASGMPRVLFTGESLNKIYAIQNG
jgi:hypothetical protein